MNMRVQIRRTDNAVELMAPYHPALPPRAKALGGRWNGASWMFDARDEARVRELARSIFGTDGNDYPELVTFRVTITAREAVKSELWMAGRLVARRRGRDLPVQLGEGVIIVNGQFPSRGGSVKYPALEGEGVVLEVRDAPRPAVPDLPNVEIVTTQTTPAANDDPLAAFGDETLIAALERRGYVVIRAAANEPA